MIYIVTLTTGHWLVLIFRRLRGEQDFLIIHWKIGNFEIRLGETASKVTGIYGHILTVNALNTPYYK